MERRINTKFVTVLLVIIAGIGVALLAASKYLIHESPERYVELGEQAYKGQHFDEALTDFGKAAKLAPKSPDIQMDIGRTLTAMSQNDPEMQSQALTAYTHALELQPRYLPALKALSDFYIGTVTQTSDSRILPALYRSAIQYSQQAHDVDPSDPKLATLADKLIVQEWISGLQSDEQQVDAAVNDLSELWKKDPGNAELPFAIARAQMQKGVVVARKSGEVAQPREVTDYYKKATDLFEQVIPEDKAGSQDRNPEMHFYYAQILELLSGLDNSTPDTRKNDLDHATREIERARALVKEKDRDYTVINEYAAEMALRRGDHDLAVHIYRSMPETPLRDMGLADVLGRDSNTRPEAEELIKTSIASLNDDPTHVVLGGSRWRLLLSQFNLQVMDYLQTTDGKEKDRLKANLQTQLDKLNTIAGAHSILLLKQAEARFMMASGAEETVAAVQNLSKLVADNPDAAKDYHIQLLLAEGYEATGQKSQALPILFNLADQFPRDINVHKRLIALLVTEAPERAGPYLADLEKQDPDDPDLTLYHIQLLTNDPSANKDQVRKYYDELPEKTPGEMSAKARIAYEARNIDDALRLLNKRITLEPKDADDFIVLAEIYRTQGQKDHALEVAQQGLTLFPDNAQLKLLIPAIKGQGVAAMQKVAEQEAMQDPDKVHGQLKLARIAEENGDIPGEEKHLKAAEQLESNDPIVWDRLFKLYIGQQRYDDAQTYATKLAGVNYDSANGALYQLSLAEARGDQTSALMIAQKMTQDKPEFANTWLSLGDVLQNQGSYESAIQQYQQCLARQSTQVSAYIGMVRCFYALHQYTDALHTIDQGLSRLPNDPELQQLKLTHELNYGNPSDAVQELQTQINEHPNEPELYAALGDVFVKYAAILRAHNQKDDAVKQAQESVQILGSALQKWPDEPSLYIAMSESQIAADDAQGALKTLQAWAQRPGWDKKPDPHMRLSEFYERFGQPLLAEDEMRTALARSGYRPDLQVTMAALLTTHQKFDDAVGLLRATNADKPIIREKLIQVLFMAGRFDDAQAELKSQLATNPPDSEVLLSLWAAALLNHKDYPGAIDKATQALSQNSGDTNVRFIRAKARLAMSPPDAAGALDDLKVVREAAPNKPEIRLYAAQADLALNHLEDAATELRAGLRSEPNNKPVRMKLVELYSNSAHPKYGEALQVLQDVENRAPFNNDPDIFQNEAVLFGKLNNPEEALARSEKALSLAPKDPTIIRTNLQLLFDAGNYQSVLDRIAALPPELQQKSWAQWQKAQVEKKVDAPTALTDFRAALVSAETEGDAATGDRIAQDIAAQFGMEEAISSVAPLADKFLDAKITLGHLYEMKGDDANSLAVADSLMSGVDKLGRVDKVNVLRSAALIYQLAKTPQVDKAYNAYQQWLTIDPTNPEALNNMACLLADDYTPTRASEGLPYAQKAVDVMTQSGRVEPRFYDTQAWLYILTGTPERGVALLNQMMLDSNSTIPEEHYHLGEGYLRMQMPLEADNQAKAGLSQVQHQKASERDPAIQTKLQDLASRSEEMMKSKEQAKAP